MDAAFRDPAVEPSPARIRSVLGGAAGVWDALVDLVEAEGLTLSWRYYRDGGWLTKVARGSVTVAWVNVATGCVRATCYFAERDRGGIAGDGDLPTDLRGRVAAVALTGKLLPVSLEARTGEDVRTIGTVLHLKLAALKRPRPARMDRGGTVPNSVRPGY